MSIGLYLATNSRVNIQAFIQKNPTLYSLNELHTQDKSGLAVLETRIDLNRKNNDSNILANIDANEKIFMYLEENRVDSFTISRDRDPGIIANYTSKQYIYYFQINHWDSFYQKLAVFLGTLCISFELWLIGEDRYEPDELVSVQLISLEPSYLEEIYGFNEYFNPIVGNYGDVS